MEDEIIINVGTLTSWNSLYRNIAPKLEVVREQLLKGKKPNIFWDFSYIQPGKVNMAALTAFLSIANSVRKNYNSPAYLIMNWDPYMLRFLSDINFFKIAEELDILKWHPNLIGGMINKLTNPSSKVLYFNDIPDREFLIKDKTKLNDWKETKREELIVDELYTRINSLFVYEDLNEDWKQHLINLLTMAVSELIVNSLLHGQDVAFVGFQKSPKGITVCVCDSGIGFLSSMKKNQTWVQNVKMNKDVDALLNASLMTKDDIGLRRAINDIIESDGYIILSSVDCELRWESNNWVKANDNFDYEKFMTKLQTAKSILGNELEHNAGIAEFKKGFYKNFSSKLRGTRITFEIPSIKKS
jgi:hypothetical protein